MFHTSVSEIESMRKNPLPLVATLSEGIDRYGIENFRGVVERRRVVRNEQPPSIRQHRPYRAGLCFGCCYGGISQY